MNEIIAGIDIGGTKITLAIATPDCQILSKCNFPTQISNGAHIILDKTLCELESLISRQHAKLLAIEVGCAGLLDAKR